MTCHNQRTYVIRQKTYAIRQMTSVIRQKTYVIRQMTYVIRHKTYVIRQITYVMKQRTYVIRQRAYGIRRIMLNWIYIAQCYRSYVQGCPSWFFVIEPNSAINMVMICWFVLGACWQCKDSLRCETMEALQWTSLDTVRTLIKMTLVLHNMTMMMCSYMLLSLLFTFQQFKTYNVECIVCVWEWCMSVSPSHIILAPG